jgi:hypothetical protein
MPLLRTALEEAEAGLERRSGNLILESNTLLQFWKPSLYLVVLDPAKADFKESARLQLDRASAFVLRDSLPEGADARTPVAWTGVPLQLLGGKPQFLQREGEALPTGLTEAVRVALSGPNGSVASEGIAAGTLGHLNG